jgi:glycine cleavage system transcriptional repressor
MGGNDDDSGNGVTGGNGWLVIITGEDRPGILDDVCGVIQRNSGQITDLRSVDVGGHFAMLVLVRIHAGAEQAMEHQLAELASYSGLRISVRPAVETEASGRPTHLYKLTACGREHVGVLKKLSHLLRVLSVNVEQIETHSEPDGSTTMTLVLGVRKDCPVTKLREFVGQLLGTSQMSWDLTTV